MRKRMLWAGLLLVVVQAVTAADDQDRSTQPAPSAGTQQAPAQPAATEPTQDGQKTPGSENKDGGDQSGGADPDCE